MPAWLKVATAVVTVVVVGGLAFAGYWFFRLQSNISKAPLSAGDSTANCGRRQRTDADPDPWLGYQ